MLTRKGRLRCDSCGKKSKRGGEFFAVVAWDLGTDVTFAPRERVSMALANHFCSSRCLADHAISEAINDMTPADICD